VVLADLEVLEDIQDLQVVVAVVVAMDILKMRHLVLLKLHNQFQVILLHMEVLVV
tara:strand:+ start:77 stop:241 length:165 start_codon:yes stop_codon:yes gene_type:complete